MIISCTKKGGQASLSRRRRCIFETLISQKIWEVDGCKKIFFVKVVLGVRGFDPYHARGVRKREEEREGRRAGGQERGRKKKNPNWQKKKGKGYKKRMGRKRWESKA